MNNLKALEQTVTLNEAKLKELFTPNEAAWLADVLPVLLAKQDLNPDRFPAPDPAPGRPPLPDRLRLALRLKAE